MEPRYDEGLRDWQNMASLYQRSFPYTVFYHYVALINRAGGLYPRPRSRFSHTDRLSSVNKMFIIWRKQGQFNHDSFNATGLY